MDTPSLDYQIATIIHNHQPDEGRPCWANERWCRGCSGIYRVFGPNNRFEDHQASLVVELIKERLGV